MKKHINLLLVILSLFLVTSLTQAQVVASDDIVLCEGQQNEVEVTLTATAYSIDLTPSGINIDDIYGGVIDMGFDFTFYGNTYNEVILSSNNYLSFEVSNALGYSEWDIDIALPSAVSAGLFIDPPPTNAILCPWQDINPGLGNGIIAYATIGEAPNRIFIVSFCGIPMYSCTSICYSSQIKLYESTNIIETHIAQKVLCDSWNEGAAIHGLHNANGTIAHIVTGLDGIERNYPNQWTCENDSWRFTPNGDNDYIIENIEFTPAVSGTDIIWQDEFGNTIDTGSEITIQPGGNVTYTATASLCGDAGAWCGFEGGVGSDDVIITFEELEINGTETDITCYNQNNGSINIIAPNNEGNWIYNLYSNDILLESIESSEADYTFENLSNGTYSTTIIESNSLCVSEELVFNIIEPNEISAPYITNNAICNGDDDGSIEITINGGSSPYNTILGNDQGVINSISGSIAIFNNLSAGNYYFTTIDNNGCLISGDEIFFSIQEPPELTVITDNISEVTCANAENGSIEVTISGGNSGQINNGCNTENFGFGDVNYDNEINVEDIVLIIDLNLIGGYNACGDVNCDGVLNSEDVNIIENFILGSGNISDCTSNDNNYTYSWSSDNGFISETEDIYSIGGGTYNLEITDSNGCTTSEIFNVTENEGMNLDGNVSECIDNDGVIEVSITGGTPNYTYNLISNNIIIDTNNNGLFTDLDEGEYYILVSDVFDCTTDTTQFNLNSAPNANFSLDSYEFYLSNTATQFIDLSDDSNLISWAWDFGDGNTSTEQNPTHLYINPGTYYVSLLVTDSENCISQTSKEISILQDYYSYSPNIFTPNGDGINDVFSPSLLNIDQNSYTLRIFDRWGKPIFETNNYDQGWNGELKNGTPLPPDIYNYRILYKTNLGISKEETGKLVIAR